MATAAEPFPHIEWVRPRKGTYRNDRHEVTHDPAPAVLVMPPMAMRMISARGQRMEELIRVTAGQVEVLLQKSTTPWRRVETLAAELGVDETVVREALDHLGVNVRRPVGARGEELNFYAPSDRPLTWQEKWRVVKSAISKIPLTRDR